MSAPKIKLQSSLNAINAKATAGKRKALPKLKAILANPYKSPNDKLSLIETCELREAMHFEVIMSGLNSRDYVKEKKISLGLHSSLRAITELKTSCVLVSDTIKPKYIVNQIVYFAKQKNFTVPVYIISNLGTLSESIYGTRALVLAFPLKLPPSVSEWIAKRNQPKLKSPETKKTKVQTKNQTKVPKIQKKPFDLNCVYLRKEENNRAFVPPVVVDKPKPEFKIKEWSGDYISLSGTTGSEAKDKQNEKGDYAGEKEKVLKSNFESEKVKVLTTLHSFMDGIKTKESGYELQVRKEGQDLQKKKELPKIVYEENDDADFVPPIHKKLKVHKIQRNPKRKQKKKIRMEERKK